MRRNILKTIIVAGDVADTTQVERLSRLVDAHQIIIRQTRKLARRASQLGDDGSNDLLVSEVLRTNELQVWFLSEHLVEVPLVKAKPASAGAAGKLIACASGSCHTPASQAHVFFCSSRVK